MRKPYQCLIILALFLGLAMPASSWDRRFGARPLGMGDVFTAVADDLNTMNYNPAGLAIEKHLELTAEYANLYPGLDDGSIQENHIAYAQNLYSSGGIGLSWNNRSIAGAYTENELMLGYALQPSSDLPLYAGLTAKLFYLAYTEEASRLGNSFFDNGFEKWQWGMDLGVLGRVLEETAALPGVQAGLSLINLNQPDLGLQSAAPQPMVIRAGAAAFYGEWDGGLDLSLENGNFQVHLGAEKWFKNREWAVRAGMIAGGETGTTWTMGGSYTLNLDVVQLRFDYSFNYAFGGIQETFGVQRLSMNLLHPLPTMDELKKMERERARQEKIEQEQLRSHAYRLIEETRGMVIKLEQAATSPNYNNTVEKFKENAQEAYALVSSEKYKASINAMEKIQGDIKYLIGQIKKESEKNHKKKAKHAALLNRVKKYLMKKILQYGSVRQKAKQLRSQANSKFDQDIYRVEKMIYEARDALVKRRDLRGFLRKLDQAMEELKKVEAKIQKASWAGIQ